MSEEKGLPDIPADINELAVQDDVLWLTPSPRIALSAHTNKALPSIKAENTLSEEEMIRLRELWNGAGLSARAHRRNRGNRTPRRPLAPITIPGPREVLSALPSADPPATSTTPSTAGIRKRTLRGFLSARPFFDKDVREKGPGALEILRAITQGRPKRKLRYAKSAPNLGDKAASPNRVPAAPMPVEAVPKDKEAIGPGPRTPSSSGDLSTPGATLQPEDMDENAIYFTIDWHASAHGGVRFQFITPVPSSPTPLQRPDSPILHRHFSLDQLTFAAQQATKTLNAMEQTEPAGCAGDEILRLIDELYAALAPQGQAPPSD